MVTAELAAAIPAVLVVLGLCLAGLRLAVDEVRCADAVRVGARLAARGEPDESVLTAVRVRLPTGVRAHVAREQGRVRVATEGGGEGWVIRFPGCSAVAEAPLEADQG